MAETATPEDVLEAVLARTNYLPSWKRALIRKTPAGLETCRN